MLLYMIRKIYFDSLPMHRKTHNWLLKECMGPYSDKVDALAVVYFHAGNLRIRKATPPTSGLLSFSCFQAFFITFYSLVIKKIMNHLTSSADILPSMIFIAVTATEILSEVNIPLS